MRTSATVGAGAMLSDREGRMVVRYWPQLAPMALREARAILERHEPESIGEYILHNVPGGAWLMVVAEGEGAAIDALSAWIDTPSPE